MPGAAGINNHEGSKFTADRVALAPVIGALAAHHVFFLDSRTLPTTQVVNVARAFGVESAGRDDLDRLYLEPAPRIELGTYGLRNRCSTTELCRQTAKEAPVLTLPVLCPSTLLAF